MTSINHVEKAFLDVEKAFLDFKESARAPKQKTSPCERCIKGLYSIPQSVIRFWKNVKNIFKEQPSRFQKKMYIPEATRLQIQGIFREVGKEMKYKNADTLQIDSDTGWMSIGTDDKMTISQEVFESFRKEEGPYTLEEIRAIMAHEISHRILQHTENYMKLDKQLNDCLDKHGTKSSLDADEETDRRARSEKQWANRQLQKCSRMHEFEADAYPLNVGLEWGIHLKSALLKLGDDNEVDDSHPALSKRLQAITRILTEKYPESHPVNGLKPKIA